MKTCLRFFLATILSHSILFSMAQNVGIGIITPAGKLHIKGSTDVSQLIIDAHSTQGNTSPLIRFRNSSGLDLMWLHSDDSTNCYVGLHAGRLNNRIGGGTYNTFIGSNTGFSNTTGNSNTANGYGALYSNISGSYNTANGYGSLYSNISGSYNTANGSYALNTNNIGEGNTATGTNALTSNTSGGNNTAEGLNALQANTTGINNTATGALALQYNTTGNNNAAHGMYTLYLNTTGSNNTAIGFATLYSNTTGGSNTAIGLGGLNYNTTGNNNTSNGSYAMYSNNSGNSNTASGYNSLYTNTTGNFNTAIGSETLYHNTDGHDNSAHGNYALYLNTTGNNNTGEGAYALSLNVGGTYNTALGAYSGVASGFPNLSNTTAIGYNATVNANNKVRIGNSDITVIEGQVDFSWPSDGRFKENIRDDVKGLEFIMKLKPVSYNFNRLKYAQYIGESVIPENEKNLQEKSQIRTVGFIAQEVEKTIQQIGFTSFDAVHAPTNESDTYSMGYAEFVVPIIKAIQEQVNIIDNQNALIKDLLKRIEALEIK